MSLLEETNVVPVRETPDAVLEKIALEQEAQHAISTEAFPEANMAEMGTNPRLWGGLGGLQLVLLFQHQTLSTWSADPWFPLEMSVLVYLLIPGLAAFLAARQGDAESTIGTGCLVGGVSTLLITITVAVSLLITLNTPPAPGSRYPFGNGFVAGIAIALVLLEGFGATVGGLFGGGIGSVLGHNWSSASTLTAPPQESRQLPADEPS